MGLDERGRKPRVLTPGPLCCLSFFAFLSFLPLPSFLLSSSFLPSFFPSFLPSFLPSFFELRA
jgi:hypothetical protein